MVTPDVADQIGGQGQQLLARLCLQLDRHYSRNRLRANFYDMHNRMRDLGIAIPPGLRNLNAVLGWPAKAVDMPARRIIMDGIVTPGQDSYDTAGLALSGGLAAVVEEAVTSALIHGTSFLLTSLGDTTVGEPDVVFQAFDAFNATGLWAPRVRGLAAGLVVLDRDEVSGEPVQLLMLTPSQAVSVIRDSVTRGWVARVADHGLGRVPLEPVTYKRRAGRPFGSSRISRAVMALTESAVRTVARAEVGAEFYSSPQRYLLGADEEAFTPEDGSRRSLWDLVMGRVLMYPEASDDTGHEMKIGQFPQISMQPHNDQMRMWAELFAAETNLPVSALGIVQDNPSSAEAIYAAKEDLVTDVEAACRAFGTAIRRAVVTGVQLREHATQVPAGLEGLAVRWRDPSTPSRAQATDAVMKQIQAGALPAESPVALEQLGFSQSDIARVQAWRENNPDALAAIAGAVSKADAAAATVEA